MKTYLALLLGFLSWAPGIRAAGAPVHNSDPVNAPLFTKPGQTRLAIAFGQKGEGIHADGGVALTPRFGLIAATSYADLNNCLSCNISERRHVEAGLAWYAPISATGLAREAMVGIATGRFRMSGSNDSWDPASVDMRVTAGHYEEIYLQADIGKCGRWIDRAGTLRLAGYRITDFTLHDGDGKRLTANASQWGLYAEPVFLFRFGYRQVKFDTQLGLSLALIQAGGVDNNPIWASLGLGVDLFGK